MNHNTVKKYWEKYHSLPEDIKILADKAFELLRKDPFHPSLHFKKINSELWSVRVNLDYRALGLDHPKTNSIMWFWIGNHTEYEKKLKSQ